MKAVLHAKHFVIRRKGTGQSNADKKVIGDNASQSPQAMVNDSYTSPAPVLSSTPLKRATTIHNPSCSTPRKRLKFVDAQTQSSPAVKSAYDVSVKDCLQKPSTASLNYEEYFFRPTNCQVQTGVQPQIFKKE